MKKLLLSIALLASCANMMGMLSGMFGDTDGPITQENCKKQIVIPAGNNEESQKAQAFQQRCQNAGQPIGQLTELPNLRISIGGDFGPNWQQRREKEIDMKLRSQ